MAESTLSPFVQETRRKLFHLFSAFYAVLYLAAGRERTLWILGPVAALSAVVEAVRLRRPEVNAALLRRFGGIQREKERTRPSGIFWMLTGVLATAAVVPHPDIVATAILYLTFGDGLAGWVGRVWGRIRLGEKSLEGSLACFLAMWLVGTLVLRPTEGAPEALVGAVIGTVLEALAPPPDDNLTIPLLSGLALWGLRVSL